MSQHTQKHPSKPSFFDHPLGSIEVIVTDLDKMLEKTGKALYSGLKKATNELLDWLCVTAPNHIANSAIIIRKYSIALLTLIIGIAFGFAPMSAFLSISSDLSGPVATILKWFIVAPSCTMQSILWWESYYSAAINTLDKNRHSHPVLMRMQLVASTLGRPDIYQQFEGLMNTEPGIAQRYAKTILAEPKAKETSWNTFSDIKTYWEEKSDDELSANIKFTNTILNNLNNVHVELSNPGEEASSLEEKESSIVTHLDSLEQLIQDEMKKREQSGFFNRLLMMNVNLFTETINCLNYLTINPFGVFFSFYTALLTITFPGLPLASIILPASVNHILIGLLGLGYSAGFIGAFYLTSNAFRRTVEQCVNYIIELLTPHDQSLLRQACQLRSELHLRIRRVNTDPTWSWLVNRPQLGMTLAVGCALSVCILNYYAGIQAAILLSNIAILHTPGALLSTASILNASLGQKLFGVYSAIITFGMTSALLMDTASTAKTKEEILNIRKDNNHNRFFYTALTLSGLGQLFCNYVYTMKPHGILSALRIIRAPFESALQTLYGLLSVGGTVLICKLQGDAADSIIQKGLIPSEQQVSSRVQKVYDTVNQCIDDLFHTELSSKKLH